MCSGGNKVLLVARGCTWCEHNWVSWAITCHSHLQCENCGLCQSFLSVCKACSHSHSVSASICVSTCIPRNLICSCRIRNELCACWRWNSKTINYIWLGAPDRVLNTKTNRLRNLTVSNFVCLSDWFVACSQRNCRLRWTAAFIYDLNIKSARLFN